VKSYIQKTATWEMPDQDTSPTLHELVSRFQVHRCNSNCTKLYKHNGKLYKKCWFGFLRPENTELELHDVTECLAVNKTQTRKQLYHLPHTSECSNIIDYNPALLWQIRRMWTYTILRISGHGYHIISPIMSLNTSNQSRMRCGRILSLGQSR